MEDDIADFEITRLKSDCPSPESCQTNCGVSESFIREVELHAPLIFGTMIAEPQFGYRTARTVVDHGGPKHRMEVGLDP
jgi:hypothetical protein